MRFVFGDAPEQAAELEDDLSLIRLAPEAMQEFAQSRDIFRHSVRIDIRVNDLRLFPKIAAVGFPPRSVDRWKRRCSRTDFCQNLLCLDTPNRVIGDQR